MLWQIRVDPASDIIYVNGRRLPKKLPPKVYLALNKPKGFVIFFLLPGIVTLVNGPFVLSILNYALEAMLILIQSSYGRYICSSGEKEFKSVISLFDDYIKSWVCGNCGF